MVSNVLLIDSTSSVASMNLRVVFSKAGSVLHPDMQNIMFSNIVAFLEKLVTESLTETSFSAHII